MNVASLQTLSDLGLKFENSPQFLTSTSAMLSSVSPQSNQTQLKRDPRAPTIQTNGVPQTSSQTINGSLTNSNLIAATSAMLQSLPHNSALDKKTKERVNYLQQLLKDKKQCQLYPTIFVHVERLLDEEIVKVRSVLFQNGDKQPLELPPPQGPTITLTEKVYVPVKDHPEYNFVGRLLGPRGLTAKQLEQETKCKIMVRGKGSMRDKKKEDLNRGKPNWEHLNDELHVLITVEDTDNRARVKMQRAMEEIQKLLIPTEGEDELKKKQLMELAIINGTYRDYSALSGQPRLMTAPHQVLQAPALRSPTPGQPPLNVYNPIISRLPNGQTVISNGVAQPPPMIAPTDGSLLYYTPFEYPHSALAPALEYNIVDTNGLLGAACGTKIVRPQAGNRVHPYQRPPATN
uniref:protein quaking-B isoform X2 n=1 Tax=Ciona intestinalis TaxID=7719 RepID=UPI00089DB040|nr:protein quaking-B isoform X2 [Ciona intestinalis]|eukprot:XP_018672062.1 protein quaking-B isoform X2 [Ciona intestinalis]